VNTYVADLVLHQNSGATSRMKAAGRVHPVVGYGLTQEGTEFFLLWAKNLGEDTPFNVALHVVSDECGIEHYEIHAYETVKSTGWSNTKGEA